MNGQIRWALQDNHPCVFWEARAIYWIFLTNLFTNRFIADKDILTYSCSVIHMAPWQFCCYHRQDHEVLSHSHRIFPLRAEAFLLGCRGHFCQAATAPPLSADNITMYRSLSAGRISQYRSFLAAPSRPASLYAEILVCISDGWSCVRWYRACRF